ncbi:hypothetical protein Vafri_6156 [Volvox africanus]|uniref:Uncharacterized protein n=1 Tax=Volvox africanus TaxID=51714 RepID=A0A8J4AXU2_9CHLO|nr:hypothetical protein Vafri_6156 [Volvox africanus]
MGHSLLPFPPSLRLHLHFTRCCLLRGQAGSEPQPPPPQSPSARGAKARGAAFCDSHGFTDAGRGPSWREAKQLGPGAFASGGASLLRRTFRGGDGCGAAATAVVVGTGAPGRRSQLVCRNSRRRVKLDGFVFCIISKIHFRTYRTAERERAAHTAPSSTPGFSSTSLPPPPSPPGAAVAWLPATSPSCPSNPPMTSRAAYSPAFAPRSAAIRAARARD